MIDTFKNLLSSTSTSSTDVNECNILEDVFHGGNKFLVKISGTVNKPFVAYISSETGKFEKYEFGDESSIRKSLKKLIDLKIVEMGKVYDILDDSFIQKINDTKNKMNIIMDESTEKRYINVMNEEWSFRYKNLRNFERCILCTLIVNEKIYCCADKGGYYYVLGPICDIIWIDFKKINNKIYDYKYLRKYLPYQLRYNSKYYYMLNRDYEYIDLWCKSLKYCECKELTDVVEKNVCDANICENSEYEHKALFNDGTTCWKKDEKENEINFQKIRNNFLELTRDKICLNNNEKTKELLSLS